MVRLAHFGQPVERCVRKLMFLSSIAGCLIQNPVKIAMSGPNQLFLPVSKLLLPAAPHGIVTHVDHYRFSMPLATGNWATLRLCLAIESRIGFMSPGCLHLHNNITSSGEHRFRRLRDIISLQYDASGAAESGSCIVSVAEFSCGSFSVTAQTENVRVPA